ncbi:hypothetical protein [Natrinema soli]|uniref:Uncharacterized protein n=1 Tax=Natrinema soli TaxID=1930624 RepID=A0ABD5T2C4_9EURY|nr:hypothetical protein [Natrinema soli]
MSRDVARERLGRLRVFITDNWVGLFSAVPGIAILYGVISGASIVYQLVFLIVLVVPVSYYIGVRRTERRLSQTSTAVEGCIESSGVLWRGRLHHGNDWSVEVEKPYCPNCQTPVQKEWHEPNYGIGARAANRRALAKATGDHQRIRVWKCSGCEDINRRQTEDEQQVRNLFEKHFRRMRESKGEFSLNKLREEAGDDPKDIWSEYAAVVDDSEVSTACFF